MNPHQFPHDAFWAIVVAVFGGLARYFDLFLREKEQLNFVRLIATLFVTGFTGWITAEIFALIYPNWKIIAAGVGGYAGSQIMDEIIRLLKLRLGAIEQQEKEKK